MKKNKKREKNNKINEKTYKSISNKEKVKIKRNITKVCLKMLDENLNISPFGNVSCRIGDKILITPSGVDYYKMKPNDIVEIDFSGRSYGGRPSSEYMMHIEIYKIRRDINAIIHAHPKYATAFAVSRVNIPVFLEEVAEVIGSDIEVAEYALPGSIELARNTAKALKNKNAVLLANHGAVCVGETLEDALNVLRILERSAEIYILAKIIGKPHILSDKDIKKLREIYMNYKKRL